MKKLLTGEKNRTKKNTTEKMITPMPMGRKQKKWMSLYMALVLTVTVGATTAFAAGDPLSVINNLSTFIFSLIRAIDRFDFAWIWCCAGWSVFKKP